MKLIFNVGYRTNWGESLFLSGNCAALGNGDYDKAVQLTLDGTEHWQATVEVPDDTQMIE